MKKQSAKGNDFFIHELFAVIFSFLILTFAFVSPELKVIRFTLVLDSRSELSKSRFF